MKALTNEILQLLNKNQEAAFEVVFKLYYPRLVYFAKEFVPESESKNLVQDAFISMWDKKPQFINESQLQSYLYTNVKNNCLMFLRHEKVKKKYKSEAAFQKQNSIYTEALSGLDTSTVTFQEIETIIEKTLSELPARCREVFVLSRMEGKKNKEVAEALNISVKAVEAQITKALKTLRVSLKDYLPLVAWLLFNINQ
ncbi:RNA polymerase sigma-70 factor, ECF subfamily [Draconibacterium orientale]|uniref:RNA polymerase n=1 Tax=Draconibacterium orientale TaxID=1168034 RepID=X5DGR3_9BACT|nr:RNA polymerase sigma-70 factor [Draconibacterium orientale]AHW60249.1 RNA polymerase [Draconibacterium orientale]SET66391.1 RNA polymerase sigma-70 factor, ECF subfamily [Draconibacterium orientale]